LIIRCQQDLHAGIFYVQDQKSGYYIAGGSDARFYGSGAMSRLMWETILYSQQQGRTHFDFEGSMVAGVDQFFKNYNPHEIKYLTMNISKSWIYNLYKKVKG
jgi:hypothetical protein